MDSGDEDHDNDFHLDTFNDDFHPERQVNIREMPPGRVSLSSPSLYRDNGNDDEDEHRSDDDENDVNCLLTCLSFPMTIKAVFSHELFTQSFL